MEHPPGTKGGDHFLLCRHVLFWKKKTAIVWWVPLFNKKKEDKLGDCLQRTYPQRTRRAKAAGKGQQSMGVPATVMGDRLTHMTGMPRVTWMGMELNGGGAKYSSVVFWMEQWKGILVQGNHCCQLET